MLTCAAAENFTDHFIVFPFHEVYSFLNWDLLANWTNFREYIFSPLLLIFHSPVPLHFFALCLRAGTSHIEVAGSPSKDPRSVLLPFQMAALYKFPFSPFLPV